MLSIDIFVHLMPSLDTFVHLMSSIKPKTETLVPAYSTASERGIRELRGLLGRLGAGAPHVHDVQPGRVSVARFSADPKDLSLSVVGEGRCSVFTENFLSFYH